MFFLQYLLAEILHYWQLRKRYNHFNDLRIESNIPVEEQEKVVNAIICKNPTLFERSVKYEHTRHITNKTQLYDMVINVEQTKPSNKLYIGCSQIYWRYHPFIFELFMKFTRQIGNMWMYCNGFKRKWYLTNDGYYSVFVYNANNDKRPIVFFPGLGLGAIPYARIAKLLNRTVYMIEVPNLSYATPLSLRHATGETLYNVVTDCIEKNIDYDIVCHSMGSVHAAMILNQSFEKNELHLIKNAVICDGFVNPIDVITSHIYPFVDYCDWNTICKRPKSKAEFIAFLYFACHNLEMNSWAKRYHNFYNEILWRDYGKTCIKYIYGSKDILYDTEYIASQMDSKECHLIQNGSHGSCFFDRKRNQTIEIIKNWIE